MTRYRVSLDPTVVGTIPPWFLSLTIDTSVVIGGRWWGSSRGTKEGLSRDRVAPLDWGDPALARWAAPLAPALLRVGGTEADRIRYGFRHDGEGAPPPDDPAFVLKGKLWGQLNRWAQAQGFGLVFTVSAGPDARGPDGRWDSRDAERLVRNTVRKGYPVVGWEFGNEVNAYPFLYGLKRTSSNRQYRDDFTRFAQMVRQLAPGTKTIGPASAIWPVIGEPNPLIPALARSPAAAFLDVLSFHYYPQQSSRGRVAVRRARQTTLLKARTLEGARRWIHYCRRSLVQGPAASAPLWVTETGHALYGGERGLSDTWLSTPWWLDQLGLMAHEGVQAVFRQSLVGGDYGLLSERNFVPRPDYFASLLWKASMGSRVHSRPRVDGPDRRLRAWHHSREDGTSCVLLVNLSPSQGAWVDLGPQPRTVRLLEPLGGPGSKIAVLDGLSLTGPHALERISAAGRSGIGPVELPALACAFVSFQTDTTTPEGAPPTMRSRKEKSHRLLNTLLQKP